MWLKDILGDSFVAINNVYQLGMEDGLSKKEIKKQKHILGVKTVQVESEGGNKVWLWFLPESIFPKYAFWAGECK